MTTAFLGLGHMGLPMATNLARSGTDLIVWNRTPSRARPLAQHGARVAESAEEAIAASDLVILMLANGEAIDTVLGRGTARFSQVDERVVVHMGTTSASYSRGLGEAIEAAGGRYIEAPVSGSRIPAETAQLIAMVAGPSELFPKLVSALRPMCKAVVPVGEVPQALEMKLAVNTFLITQVVGLAESFHLARSRGLDLRIFQEILDTGPMASAVSVMKLEKLVTNDFQPQAALSDVLYNARLIESAARESGVQLPLLEQAVELFQHAEALGHGFEDMAAVYRALESDSSA